MKRLNGHLLSVRVIIPDSNGPDRQRYVTIDQIGESEYIKRLKREVEEREHQKYQAELGKVGLDNYLLEEIRYFLQQYGSVSSNRLSRELNVNKLAIETAGKILKRAKLITIKKNRRGILVFAVVAQR